MCQAFNQAGYRLLWPVRIAGDPIANLHDGAPVLGRLVLIGGLVCRRESQRLAGRPNMRIISSGEHTDGLIVGPGRSRSEHGDG